MNGATDPPAWPEQAGKPAQSAPPVQSTQPELQELRRSLAAVAAQLNEISARVDEVARRQPVPVPAVAAGAPRGHDVVSGPPPPVRPRPAESPVPPWARVAPPSSAPIAAAPGEGATSWADTAGLKVLGWVGGGVTVLGIVLLLVIAAQQGVLGPLARVIIGTVLGVVLLGGGLALHLRPHRAALAVTVVCTGLAVEYLTTVGAVRLADLLPPMVGHGASAVIVVVAVTIAVAWREPWLAGASFLVSGLLAPVVGDGFGSSVLAFEAVMVAGGAACLLLGLGIFAWAGAGIAALVASLLAMVAGGFDPTALVIVIVMVAIDWAAFVGRWVTGRMPLDPGPFPLRPRSYDPDRIARDYADFHAHERLRAEAHTQRATADVSLAVGAGLLALALAVAEPAGRPDLAAGIVAAVLAVLFALLAWASGRHAALAQTPVRVVAWCGTIAVAAVALLRLLSGDARSVSWMVLATVVLVIVAVERLGWLLAPALAAAGVALLAAGPALNPADLLSWPASGLVADGAVRARGWAVVLPAGLCLIALCVAAWWSVARVTAARTLGGASAAGVFADGHTAEHRRTTVMGWTLVCCSAVACYGLIAVTMVIGYAVSPTYSGYQGGQIVVTVFVTLVALALLWQGFRRLVVRLGGLGLAAVAVAKLLLFDTSSLQALPRAITVIAVGLLLLLGAVAYMTTLSRVHGPRDPGGPTATGPAPAGPAAPPGDREAAR